MLIESDFQSDSNDREILPAEFSHLPYICMLTDLIKYNGIFPWHWHSALEIDYIMEGDIEFRTPEHTMLLKKGDAVFVNSEILHTYHARGSTACKLYAILFDAHQAYAAVYPRAIRCANHITGHRCFCKYQQP